VGKTPEGIAYNAKNVALLSILLLFCTLGFTRHVTYLSRVTAILRASPTRFATVQAQSALISWPF
jgi:hypothetical protein